MSTSHFYLQEIWEGRDGSLDETGVRNYTRTFLAGMTFIGADALEVTAGSGVFAVPGRLSPYVAFNPNGTVRASDLGARLVKYECRQQEDPQFWKIYCRYSSDWRRKIRTSYDPTKKEGTGGQSKGDPSEIDPLQEPPDFDFQGVKYQRPIKQDVNGKDYVASNGEAFIPPVMRDDTRGVLRITQNMATYAFGQFQPYFDTVNSQSWFGFDALTVKCSTINGQSVHDRGQLYFRVTGIFEIRTLQSDAIANAWDHALLDEGTYQLDANNKPAVILDQKTGMPITARVPLDGQGHPLNLTPPVTYHYRTFQPYPTKDFNQLPFRTS